MIPWRRTTLLLGLLPALCACSETTDVDALLGGGGPVTSVRVSPEEFLGDVVCAPVSGAMQSYVVTLIDVTDPARPVTLPSSPATPCSEQILFRQVIADHVYTAEIDGYEQAASELLPYGGIPSGSADPPSHGNTSGSRLQHRKGTNEPVDPRWTTSCGKQAQCDGGSDCPPVGAAIAKKDVIVGVARCDVLTDRQASPKTAITVDLLSTLGELGCEGDAGALLWLDLVPLDAPLPSFIDVACSSGLAPFAYSAGLEVGRQYDFRVDGRSEKGGAIEWSARCHATAAEGFTVPAVCDPLTAVGTVIIDAAALATAAGTTCGQGSGQVVSYEVLVEGPAKLTEVVGCGPEIRIEPLEPGDYSLAVKGRATPVKPNEPGPLVFEASCTATALPGQTAQAACSVQ